MITIIEFDKTQKLATVHKNPDWRQFRAQPDRLYWWDIETPGEDENLCLSEHFHFHPLAIEDCISEIHYPKIDFYESYLYMVIHGVDVDLSVQEGFAPKELDIFLGKDFLVTYHIKPARSVSEILRRVQDTSPIFEQGVDFVLYSILDVLVTNYLPILETIEDALDNVEEKLFENPDPPLLRTILGLKRTLMRLKKTVFPQREVINHLARNEYLFVQPRTQAYFRDVYDQLYRMAEMTESFRDVTTALVETYLSTVSNRMNQIMKVLTLFATIFMPLTFLAGVYGMNFQNLPELRWHYGYYYLWGVMAMIVAFMLGIFRWKKWV